MRKLIGSVVLTAGVAGLGYVAMTQTAPAIQSTLLTNAQAVVADAPNPLGLRVSGRDVALTGVVRDASEQAALETALLDISGVRVVDVSGLETLPVADPYMMQVSRAEDGTFSVDGVLPSNAVRDQFGGEGGNLFANVTLASGMPDEAWPDVLMRGMAALSELEQGELTLTNRTVTLQGAALLPSGFNAATATLDDLPPDYRFENEITVLDDGTPFRLTVGLRDGGVNATGKLPQNLASDIVTDRFEIAETLVIAPSVLGVPHERWAETVVVGLDALAGLIEADLSIVETDVSLIGVGSPDGIAQAEAALANLPDVYSVTTNLGLYDDGAPLELRMDWDGTTALATGKYPAEFAPRGPAGVAVQNDGRARFAPDTEGAFTANANAGVAALGLMNTGALVVTETTIVLTGTASSPQVGEAMDNVLSNAAPDADIQRDLTYLDDGSPAAWALRYDAQSGALIEGRLPNGLSSQALADALGLPALSGTPAIALEDSDLGSATDTFALLSTYLPELEMMSYSNEGGSSALDLVLSPGVDIDLVAVDLAEQLPVDVAFSLAGLDDLPANGTTRINQATGLEQVFTDGFWLPNLDFVADDATCTAQTQNVLSRSTIAFLSASARLDASSIRAINALAAVALPCVTAGHTLEVGGHTDATGSEINNQALSADRANAVRAALIERGIPAASMTAFGFGQSQPIADNSTPEGREANRRTDITWYAPGALRDP